MQIKLPTKLHDACFSTVWLSVQGKTFKSLKQRVQTEGSHLIHIYDVTSYVTKIAGSSHLIATGEDQKKVMIKRVLLSDDREDLPTKSPQEVVDLFTFVLNLEYLFVNTDNNYMQKLTVGEETEQGRDRHRASLRNRRSCPGFTSAYLACM